jgi:hypothetical protein
MVFTWGAEQKLGTKAIVRMKIVIRKGRRGGRRGDQTGTGFLTPVGSHSHKFYPPVLDFALPVVPSLLLVFFIKSSLCKILQIL